MKVTIEDWMETLPFVFRVLGQRRIHQLPVLMGHIAFRAVIVVHRQETIARGLVAPVWAMDMESEGARQFLGDD
ncbi:hypothetical protein HNO86_27125 [Pseudomonas sp. C1C7]|uniref:hypothetical protein n=1 Tax=Pseudomonas sp. C1C7 TaxID=2735272 RepID=UPI00158651BE|nr:hypothetical protein [Pseudomonas sp. C1C7]NUT78717.1 hypothetical protein [Pseudomonas sp. C1C7]